MTGQSNIPVIENPLHAPFLKGSEGGFATATIESLSYDARGVTHIEGKAVFVEGALPGETVRLAILRQHRRYDNARLAEVLEPSPDRVAPPCPHFGVCGGCSLQHLRTDAQLAAKQYILASHLTHIGKVMPEAWLAPLAGAPFGYRRRARLGVRLVPKKGGVLIGFREKRRSYIAPLMQCLTLTPETSALLPALKSLVESLSGPDQLPQIEVAVGDNAVALTFRHLYELTEEDRNRLRTFGERHRTQIWLQSGGPDSLTALWPGSPERLRYSIPEFGVTLEFRPTDFVQVNAPMNQQMVGQAMKLLDLAPQDRVLDLFCGLGNFTLPIARRAGHVLGVEAEGSAVEMARQNARLNKIDNVEFRAVNLYDEKSSAAPWGDFHFDKLLLDPPRTGAIEAIKRLADPLPGRIVYVSCNPSTLARDSQYLAQVLGYRLATAGAMDMFPQTSHVESMALFVR